jgi:hypothetical protein
MSGDATFTVDSRPGPGGGERVAPAASARPSPGAAAGRLLAYLSLPLLIGVAALALWLHGARRADRRPL